MFTPIYLSGPQGKDIFFCVDISRVTFTLEELHFIIDMYTQLKNTAPLWRIRKIQVEFMLKHAQSSSMFNKCVEYNAKDVTSMQDEILSQDLVKL